MSAYAKSNAGRMLVRRLEPESLTLRAVGDMPHLWGCGATEKVQRDCNQSHCGNRRYRCCEIGNQASVVHKYLFDGRRVESRNSMPANNNDNSWSCLNIWRFCGWRSEVDGNVAWPQGINRIPRTKGRCSHGRGNHLMRGRMISSGRFMTSTVGRIRRFLALDDLSGWVDGAVLGGG